MQTVIAIAITASLGGAATLASPSLIGESQSVACQHELTILQQAIDIYPVVSAEMEPPTPRGIDGLEDLRDLRLIRKTSRFWVYTGVDEQGVPRLEQSLPVENCPEP